MMFRHLAGAAVLSTLLAGSAAADQTVCELTNTGGAKRGSGSVFSPVLFIFDDAQKAVQVLDPLVYSIAKKPIAGRLRTRASGLQVSWTVNDVEFVGGTTSRIRYTANLNADKSTVAVRGRIPNAENFIAGKGTCREMSDRGLKQTLDGLK